MSEITLSKLEIAQRQLELAIALFLTDRDRISAITLAGAADGILHGLVLKEGKSPFSDYAHDITQAIHGRKPTKAKHAKHINTTLKINQLKHMDADEPSEVTLDVDISALGAILKAIENHHLLVEDHPDYIKLMLQWSWQHFDGEKIIDDPETPAGLRMMDDYDQRSDKVRKVDRHHGKND